MSTGNKLTVQQAAKQGNPQAIAILLNRQLQPKGITAKLSTKDSCLQIMLEAANVPNQKGLVIAIQKWIDGLGIDSIQRVQIYAKQTSEDIPAWNDSFEVIRQLEDPKIADTGIRLTVANETSKNDVKVEKINTSKSDSGLLELAKNGDTKAISELIKNRLSNLLFLSNKIYVSNKKLVVLSLLLIILASGLVFSFFSKKKLIDSPTAKASLTELKKINSRMEVGINLLEYPKEVSNYKFTAETFINSNDSSINPKYTELIKDSLEAHIYAFNVWEECQTQRPDCKVEEIFNGQSTRKSSLISKLLTRYPNLNEKLKTIKASDTDNSFVSTTIEKNDMLQYLWSYAKAAEDSASIEINR